MVNGLNLPSSKLKGDSGIESPSLPAAVPHICVELLLQILFVVFIVWIFDVDPENVVWHSTGEIVVPEE